MRYVVPSLVALLVATVSAAEVPCTPDPREEIIAREGSDAFIPPQLVAGSSVRVRRPPSWVDDTFSFTFLVGLDGRPDIMEVEVLEPVGCAPYRFWELPDDLQQFLIALVAPLHYHPATRAGRPVEAKLAAPIHFPIFYKTVPSSGQVARAPP